MQTIDYELRPGTRDTFNTITMDQCTASRTVVVGLEEGLHLTPLRALTLLAETFSCDISIRRGDQVVDAKSMLELMSLMAVHNTELVLSANGADAEDAVKALGQLFDSNFRPV